MDSSHISKPHVQILPNFLYMLPVIVARSSSDGNALRYVVPVLWTASYFPTAERWARLKDTRMLRPVRQMAAPVGRHTTLFGRDRCVAPPAAKSLFEIACLFTLHLIFANFILTLVNRNSAIL